MEEALANRDLDISIFGGRVIYKDYLDESVFSQDASEFIPYLCKRVSFSHENEFRLVHIDIDLIHEQYNAVSTGLKDPNDAPKTSMRLPCDINALVQRVQVSPLAEKWFLEVVRSACKTYDIKAPVEQSTLYDDPLK